ncbi:hypothetical protein INR49_012018 [Caranx melampygus]|nr:hypothetical protein INR49_012018 [Caranx melampygus]
MSALPATASAGMLGCEAHRCQEACHRGPCQPCPRSPSLVKTCPCGQTPLAKLLELGYTERQSCSDPIPSCGKTCNKPLACGSSEELIFTCERRCNKKRSCGRHKCGELCCVVVEHKCSLICGYKLNCGLHRCQDPCHRGNCEPCWQSSFDELTCHCGLTVLYPPIPVAPSLQSAKTCVQDDTSVTTQQRSNIPCHLQDISCGLACNKLLPCEMHRCKRICHRGDCLAEGGCQQPCALPRPDCGHPCSVACHKGSSCPRTTCTAKVQKRCHREQLDFHWTAKFAQMVFVTSWPGVEAYFPTIKRFSSV